MQLSGKTKETFSNVCAFPLQVKESATKNTDLQHQLEKAKQQHQELQVLQQNTNGKLREAQVLWTTENVWW